MRPETKLARVFSELVDGGKKLDSVAADILAIVAEARVRTVDAFNPLVSAAYQQNGWNPRAGRPSADTKGLGEVPGTVRTYVTTIRRALRRGIDVSKMETFYELRQALRKAKGRSSSASMRGLDEETRSNFEGVGIDATNDLNGALIHDVGVIYARLPKSHRTLFERQLQHLVSRYLPLAQGIQTIADDEGEERQVATG